jgi:hypothetical protein
LLPPKLAISAAVILLLLGGALLVRGLGEVLLPNSATQAKDLRTNWTQLQMVLHHENPYRDPATASPYPPWTFPANVALYALPWGVAKLWFVFLNLGCLLLLAAWAWRQALPAGKSAALLNAASWLAISAIATGLGLGQNAIVYTSVLTAVLVLYQKGWKFAAGLLLGIAMSKINITLPFILPFAFRKEWKVAVAAVAYMVTAGSLVALWVHAPPLEIMRLWVAAAQRNNGLPYGPASLLTAAGMSAGTASRLTALVFMGAAVVVLGYFRNVQMLTLFGLAAGFGRLWTYHRVYDNVMLIFLLVALGELASRSRRGLAFLAWLLVGLTLWIPIRPMDVPVTHLIHVLIWMGGMFVLAAAKLAKLGVRQQVLTDSPRF